MTLTITIDLDNAAFDDVGEVPRLLKHIADVWLNDGGIDCLHLRDINGNGCGVAITRGTRITP